MKKKLIEARELAFKNADAIAKLAETEDRSLTPEEQTKVSGFHTEMEDLDKQIETIEKQESLRAKYASQVPAVHGNNPAQDKSEKELIKRYNILKAMNSLADPSARLEGVELEMDQEARKEMREAGISHLVKGGINIPSFAMRQDAQKRANEQVAGVPAQGGFTVGSDLVEVIGVLRPSLAVRQAGARVLTGLSNNLDFTTQDTGAVTNWNTEIESADQTGQTYSQRSMTPNRLAAWTPVSLQLLAQSSIDMQNFVIQDLNDAMNQALEVAVFTGSGVAPVPQGLIGLVPNLAAGDPDGGAFTFDLAVDMETSLSSSETDFGKLAYIINSKTYGALKKERTDPGSGLFTIAQDSYLLNGKRVFVTNNLPDNLTKGAGTDLSAAIYGNWNDLLIGNWGGANIVIDPYTSAKEGMINYITNTFWDIMARRLNSFVTVSDIVTG